MKRIRKYSIFLLLALGGFLLLVFLFLNIPFTQRYSTKRVNQILVSSSVPIHLDAIRTILPGSVRVQGVSIIGPMGDTLVYCGELYAGIRPLALFRKKVMLKHVELDAARVGLERWGGAEQINIAEAFSGGKDREHSLEARSPANWLISIKNGSLSNIHFRMNDSLSGVHILQDAAEIALGDFRISLEDRQIELNTLHLARAGGEVRLDPRLIPPEKKTGPWNVSFRRLVIEDTDFRFSKSADKLALETHIGKADIRANAFDMLGKNVRLNRIDLDGSTFAMEGFGTFHDLEVKLADLSYDQRQAGLDIRKISFALDNGFRLDRLNGRLDSDKDRSDLQAEIQTANGQIKMKAFALGTIEEILALPSELTRAGLELSPSHISLEDISAFMPHFREEPIYKAIAGSLLEMNGAVDLEDGALHISGLSVSQKDNYAIALEGIIQHPFRLAEASGKIHMEAKALGQDWLQELAVASGLSGPLPDLRASSLEADLSDSILSPRIDLSIESPIGSAVLQGSVDFKRELFSLAYEIRSLVMDQLFPAWELGSFTGVGEFKGKGFSGDQLQASYYVHVDTLDFKAHAYSNAQITGTIEPGAYDLQLVAKDTALKADLQLSLDLGDSEYRAKASGIFQAQLDELHLYEEPLNLETSIQAEMTRGKNGLESELSLRDLRLSTGDRIARVHELKAFFNSDSLQSRFQADADFFNARVDLWSPLEELDTLGRRYKHYFGSFRKASHMTAANRVSFLPEIQAIVSLQDHELLDILLGDSILKFHRLEGSISKPAHQNSLHASVMGEQLSYNFLETTHLFAELSDSAGTIHMDLLADSASVLAGSDHRIVLQTSSSNQDLLTGVSVQDYQGRTVYRLDLRGQADSSRIAITVPDKEIILNTEVWKLDTPDLLFIDLADNKIWPALSMRSDSSILRLGAREVDPHITYTLDLSRVQLSSLMRNDLFKGVPDGTISGTIAYETGEDPGKKLDTELLLDHLHISGEEFSKIRVDGELSWAPEGVYALDLMARMDSLDVKLNGGRDEAGDHRMTGTINHFPLILLDPFIETHVSELEGSISGDFLATEQSGEAQLNGELVFQDARLKVNMLNTRFSIPDQRLAIREERAEFKDFTVLDSLKKPLTVNGHIDFSDRRAPTVDLTISSEEMQVMTRNERSRVPFTGNILIDSRLQISGPISRPSVGGNIRLSEGTEIYYHHTDDLRMTETEKIVNFASYEGMEEEITVPALSVAGRMGSSSIGTVIRIDPSTRINFTLGKRMFDIDLQVLGGGDIQYNLENDQMSVSGRYEIGEGNAFLKLVGWPNKTFRLVKGGYIRWDGMVENPELNIAAENRISTSYVNPIDGRNRDIDFYVILSMKGYLSELDVLFTIRTPDQYVMSVINALGPEEQMRQAISVLLFETIDLPGISSSTNYMTQQVNQIISSQMNQLTQSAIKGVDISFGLDTYDESGQDGSGEMTTSLSYEVSKTFMNNRAQIEFSGRLKDANQASTTTDHSLNNLSFVYTLDSAATKYLKVYNEHSYDDVFEGEVIQTGIGFKYTRRYKSFKDIWRRKR